MLSQIIRHYIRNFVIIGFSQVNLANRQIRPRKQSNYYCLQHALTVYNYIHFHRLTNAIAIVLV